ncbi:transcriptional repressor [Poseidonocella sedimentorum]|uniref:Fur family transcriptional regulator, zinc uptake regulator n=1 Tax=Poseidonocella sedimentorum TaxID=871652 RepID=A0A1I6D302_9RHOB|nr:transcriptional repressor [Poseidonocella sedimentorum]SFQ99743.1 Fur family transcriptional regulator, zinc uptake regulator [Poseidonocella sedimentorum]
MIGFEKHDHGHCITDAVSEAERHCAAEGLQFTPIRRRVLELLLAEHRAMGAYEVLDHLREEGLGSQPPVAYRALDFLVKHGFAHRIEKLNAFAACAHPGEDHVPVFLICRGCNGVAETTSDTARGVLVKDAAATGFTLERVMVEGEGLCPKCTADDTAGGATGGARA